MATKLKQNKSNNILVFDSGSSDSPQSINDELVEAAIEIEQPKKAEINKFLLKKEFTDAEQFKDAPDENRFLYPNLNDPQFNIKIAEKKEFHDMQYDGEIDPDLSVEERANILSNAEFELSPHQGFVKNFLSFQTPYNSLLLYHGLGSGKTCSAIGVCEEMRDYLKQMAISKRIIIVASPNVQDNFRTQLFDERRLKLTPDGNWNIKSCIGNKLIKEINPMSMKGLPRDKVISQIKLLINGAYVFMGYDSFANYIRKTELEIVRNKSKSRIKEKINITELNDKMKRNLNREFSNRLIVIDEVHNIRITDDNENKKVAQYLMRLVESADNMRLLLLSATPMYNSYKEIIYLLNVMNANDRRATIDVKQVFKKDGSFVEGGKELLIRKATGYVSFVRGENPYTFPYRVYPDQFALRHTFDSNKNTYPTIQMNGKPINPKDSLKLLKVYLTTIGKYQNMGYKYILDQLRKRKLSITTKKGVVREMPTFENMESFGYTLLQVPLEALNIVYPVDNLEDLVEGIQPMKRVESSDSQSSSVVFSPGVEPDYIDAFEPEETLQDENASATALDVNTAVDETALDVNTAVDETALDVNTAVDETALDVNTAVDETALDVNTALDETALDVNTAVDETALDVNTAVDETATVVDSNVPNKEEIVELTFQPSSEESISSYKYIKGGTKHDTKYDRISSNSSNSSNSTDDSGTFEIDPHILTGRRGLERIMSFTDLRSPPEKGDFEYREKYQDPDSELRVFSPKNIGIYSAKIKNICDSIVKYDESTGKAISISDGVILIYSQYIDGGLIPVALALEEMGFIRYGQNPKTLFKTRPTDTIDVRTMKPMKKKTKAAAASASADADFLPARYIMITGDPRISPNNNFEVKGATNDDNVDGHKVKVILISQAGSEGVDFKFIRQVHILEPWYNMNRIEQIIGRAVRNLSHKDLPYKKRNVEIFMYGTLLTSDYAYMEAADLYVYRLAELKSAQIGEVSRLLKQTAVDCIINYAQTNFTQTNFEKALELKGEHITQVLSNGKEIDDFKIGDADYTSACDYQKCEYQCTPFKKITDADVREDTYGESFILQNNEQIIQRIKHLFGNKLDGKFFYKKQDLINEILRGRAYPIVQIYAALTQMVEDSNEFILDKYGRTGYLVNIGEYYLFQPNELNNLNASIFDRSVPIDYKHSMIEFSLKKDALKPKAIDIEEPEIIQPVVVVDEFIQGKAILAKMQTDFDVTREYLKIKSVPRGDENWYKHCAIAIRKLNAQGFSIEDLLEFLVAHIIEMLLYADKIELVKYLYSTATVEERSMADYARDYFDKKIQKYKQFTFIVFYNIKKQVFLLADERTNRWLEAEPEDQREINIYLESLEKPSNLNTLVGFIDYEIKTHSYMVFKVKNMVEKRNVGARCDNAGKKDTIKLLNSIYGMEKFTKENTKGIVQSELCATQEFTMRYYNKIQKDGNTWFLDTESAKELGF